MSFFGYLAILFAANIGNFLFKAITALVAGTMAATCLSWLPFRATRWIVCSLIGFCSTFGVLWVTRWLFGIIAGPDSYGFGVFVASLVPVAIQAVQGHRRTSNVLIEAIEANSIPDDEVRNQIPFLTEFSKRTGIPLPGDLLDQNLAQTVGAIVFWKLYFQP